MARRFMSVISGSPVCLEWLFMKRPSAEWVSRYGVDEYRWNGRYQHVNPGEVMATRLLSIAMSVMQEEAPAYRRCAVAAVDSLA